MMRSERGYNYTTNEPIHNQIPRRLVQYILSFLNMAKSTQNIIHTHKQM